MNEYTDDIIESSIEVTDKHNEIKDEAKSHGLTVVTRETEAKKTEILISLTDENRINAVRLSLIPESYKNSKFDIDRVRENLVKQHRKDGGIYKIRKFSDYSKICYSILSAIRCRELPDKSYVIGAPNGFGKTSFVCESIMTALAVGFTTAPYVSLIELAQIKKETEKVLLKPFNKYSDGISMYELPNDVPVGYQKNPEIVIGRYSYSEYINAEILFVSLSGRISKEVESHTLQQLISIRGQKGLPTIVMMSTSLDPYINDKKLKEYIWDEILTYDESPGIYDRLYHVSCYKRRSGGIENKYEEVDEDTGIID